MTTYYTSEHEWISVDGDVGTVGITKFAAEKLGDVVFVELPDVGKSVKKEADMAVVESVKAASDVYAPVTGEVTAANAAIDHIHDWVLGTPEGDWVSMGVAVDGQYGIDKGIICGLPCVAKNGQWSVVEGLELDAFSKPRIDASVAELREEYDAVKELGLI